MPNIKMSQSFTFDAAPGVSLYYEVSGHCPDGRRLLFLHGFGASTENWSDVRPAFEAGFCVTALDLKGHGRSSHPRDEDYFLDTQAELLLRFLEARCPGETVIIGHSYGGAVALLAMVKAQQKQRGAGIKGLVLADAPAYPQPIPPFLSVLYAPILGRLAALVPSRMAASYSLGQAFYDKRKITDAILDRYARAMDVPGGYYAMARAAEQIMPRNLDEYLTGLRSIAIPTALVWGDHDEIVKPSTGKRLLHDIRGSTLQMIKDCGHVPQEEQPKAFIEAVEAFLATLPSQS